MSHTNTPTPHNAAKHGDIAETVIMAGDPMRVKYIAETFLENPILYNSVRGMFGYTGTYKGKRISVQGHGMGVPSIGIYSYELFHFYGVKQIIRIGTCGTFDSNTKLGSLVVAQGACTDSAYAKQFDMPGTFSAIADFDLMRRAVNRADELGLNYKAGNILTTDVFYDEAGRQKEWARFGVIAAEMEAYGLYINAAACGGKALAILTVSDNIATGERLSSEERQLGMDKMIELALTM